MKVYTYSQLRQKLAGVLDEAAREGAVQIRRRDGQVFELKPIYTTRSPLDVPAITTDITTDEIVQTLRESRERGR